MKTSWLARLPAGFFAIPYTLFGLCAAWRRATVFDWPMASTVNACLLIVVTCVWGVLMLCYAAKCILYPHAVVREIEHPVQGAMLALLPLSTLLAAANWGHPGSQLWLVLALLALALQGVLAVREAGRLSTGKIPASAMTPAMYLPLAAGGLVGGLTLATLGYAGCGALLFGAGMSAWALLELRVFSRVFEGPMPEALRPTIGVELAPAPVAILSAAAIWPQLPGDVLMMGLGIAVGPIITVLARHRWWYGMPFSSGFWSFGFPAAALAGAVVEAVRRSSWPPLVAGIALLLASTLIAFLVVRTIGLMLYRKLLPPAFVEP